MGLPVEDSRELSPYDFFVYLDSVKGLYPGGIPAACLRDEADGAADAGGGWAVRGRPDASLVFVACSPGGEGGASAEEFAAGQEMFEALLSRGFGLSLGQVLYLQAPSHAGPETAAALEKLLQRPQGGEVIIVAFGAAARRALGGQAAGRGEWQSLAGAEVMTTHALETAAASSDVKRELWSDMKKVLARLAEAGG